MDSFDMFNGNSDKTRIAPLLIDFGPSEPDEIEQLLYGPLSPANYCECGECRGAIEDSCRFCCRAPELRFLDRSTECFADSVDFLYVLKAGLTTSGGESMRARRRAAHRNFEKTILVGRREYAEKHFETKDGQTIVYVPHCIRSKIRNAFDDAVDPDRCLNQVRRSLVAAVASRGAPGRLVTGIEKVTATCACKRCDGNASSARCCKALASRSSSIHCITDTPEFAQLVLDVLADENLRTSIERRRGLHVQLREWFMKMADFRRNHVEKSNGVYTISFPSCVISYANTITPKNSEIDASSRSMEMRGRDKDSSTVQKRKSEGNASTSGSSDRKIFREEGSTFAASRRGNQTVQFVEEPPPTSIVDEPQSEPTASYCLCGRCSGYAEDSCQYCCQDESIEGFSPDECYTRSPTYASFLERADSMIKAAAKNRRFHVIKCVTDELQMYPGIFARAKKDPKTGRKRWPAPHCVVSDLRRRYFDENDAKNGHTGFNGELKKKTK